jgi:hypothetical protein
MISTVAAARWACNTATAIVRDLIDAVPDGALKKTLASRYKFGFEKIV